MLSRNELPAENVHKEISMLLARSDQRYTSGRRRLVEALQEMARPVTPPQIREHNPELTQSSAYRNLDLLEKSGAIRRLASNGDHSHYELGESLLGHHHHLICVGCESITDVELPESLEKQVDNGLDQLARAAGFAPTHHTLDLFGTCSDCTE